VLAPSAREDRERKAAPSHSCSGPRRIGARSTIRTNDRLVVASSSIAPTVVHALASPASLQRHANIRSLTSQGHAHARFRRALDRGNATEALSAAAELPQVGLTEALQLCLLLADDDPSRFERGALRWHERFCREVSDVSLVEAQAVLALLAGLGGKRPVPAAHSLAELFDRRALEQASKALIRWAQRRTAR
jgi:hypothetical protein